ncbi:MAG: hypothetical protein H6Q33_4629 [Deltaproteobacteria bacterium]|nr:hypothetical protein [Deltaproteobacteria bacterium]
MAETRSRQTRLLSSLSYAGLVALAAALGYLTFRATQQPRGDGQLTEAVVAPPPFIELSGFSARREKTSDAERLNVTLRLRLSTRTPIDCYVYIVARNEHVSPKLWVSWPDEAASALTTGGHFRGGSPPSGQAIRLTSSWTRVNATISHPAGRPPFDTVTVYLVGPEGEILLERPFAL